MIMNPRFVAPSFGSFYGSPWRTRFVVMPWTPKDAEVFGEAGLRSSWSEAGSHNRLAFFTRPPIEVTAFAREFFPDPRFSVSRPAELSGDLASISTPAAVPETATIATPSPRAPHGLAAFRRAGNRSRTAAKSDCANQDAALVPRPQSLQRA